MPLWHVYHPEGAWTPDDKRSLAERITALYSRLPKFYVGVVFQAVAKDSFFIGGEPRADFVRIWIDHIARTLPTPEIRARWLARSDEAIAPFVRDRGFDWEYHIDETSPELWSIQGHRPPPPGSADEARWLAENRASPLAEPWSWPKG